MGQYDAERDDWIRRSQRVVDDKLMQDIVNDFWTGPTKPGPTLPTANPVDAAPVKTGTDTVSSTGTGWADSPEIKNWKAPGIDLIDEMVTAQDRIDRAQRVREQAEAVALARAEAEFLKSKERKDKGQE
jgi:hypothetical protein